MKREAGGPCLSALFVDYDNIYLSLKRKSEEAAKRFAKDAGAWLREIEGGRLITPTNAQFGNTPRRIVMNRCYGNPVPRRNQHDNSTDMNSFPFVRHNFLRAGFEVIDCPPLTAQLKNSADIRMVMDIRDLLMHDTYFDEFIILSGDADFTPVLIRLRAHARRTVIFANDFTAAPYTAISDGEVREANLIELILAGELPAEGSDELLVAPPPKDRVEDARRQILAEVVAGVRSSPAPVPLEALADRALRALGHEKTIATGWAGAGSFRELLRRGLPDEIRLTDEPPYLAFDARRHIEPPVERRTLDVREPRAEIAAPAAPRMAPQQLTAEPVPHYQTPAPTPSIALPRAAPAMQHLAEEPPLRPARRSAPVQREAPPPP
ncbi:MAG: NYN domain-containing protein, partial [Hyphomonadaceae bacterium]|nr:NYN domain-containing protein [Hyphomonadaceae bacterium]